MPEAKWLRKEADDYHQCILDAIARSIKPHPLDPSLTWVPDELYEESGKSPADNDLYQSAVTSQRKAWLAPEDTLFSMIESSLRRAGCMK